MGRYQTFYVIAYDIPDDKRRRKIHNLLCGYCTWSQYSLFEGFLTDKEQLALEDNVRKILNEDQDSLRLYPLCAADVKKIVTIGSKPPTDDVEIII